MPQRIQTMLSLQDQMNLKVHAQWREQGFAWYRAIWTECAELMDHYGWKWWKKQDPDQEQIQLEIVDIWHFGLSDLLLHHGDLDALAAEVLVQLQSPDPLAADFRVTIENLAEDLLVNKRFSVAPFANLMHAADMDVDQLYRMYIGKNVLNFFRQDHGYKDGSYVKQWQGREDNEHLAEIIASLDSSHADFQHQVYAQLQRRYEQATRLAAV